MRLLPFLLFLFPIGRVISQNLSATPMMNSIGINVTLPPDFDPDGYGHCSIRYRETSSPDWQEGFHGDRIKLNGADQYRLSLFLLEPGTSYTFEVTLVDSVPNYDVLIFPSLSVYTLPEATFATGNNLKYVAPNGSGTAYSAVQPGKLSALLSSGQVGCGTTIMLMDGIYSEMNLSLNLTSDCSENNPITFMAVPGAHPTFDGAVAVSNWTPHASDPNLYSAALPPGTDFTNLCLLNGQMLYPYPTLTANILFGNYNLSNLNLQSDGFIRDNNVIWIKTAVGTNPNNGTVLVSKAFRFLTVYGNNKQAYLKFKGITVKNIGKSNVNGTTAYSAIAFDFRNLHHVVFDSCSMEYDNFHVVFTGQCNDILIQNCRFKQGNGLWSHAMTKKSNDGSLLFPTSMARFGETGAINLSDNKRIIIKNNVFEGTNSGVVSNFNTGLIEEADIYENIFTDNFDAIECDGNWCNLRVWQNEIIRPMAGFSIAPPQIGPRYFYRNTIHHLTGRHNVQDDPYFIGCQPVTQYNSSSLGIKTNSGVVSVDPANLYFINNTFHSSDSLGYAFSSWDSEWRNAYFINNIFYDETKNPGYFHSLANKPNYQFSSTHDDYFSKNENAPLLVAKEIHGQFVCHEIFSIFNFQGDLQTISGSSNISFTNTRQLDPKFINLQDGGFELSAGSPLIDQGIEVPGFYDFSGAAPDIGAKETALVGMASTPSQSERISIFPNPANNQVNILLSHSIENGMLYICNSSGQIVFKRHFADTSAIFLPLDLSSGVYFIQICIENDRIWNKLLLVQH
ncbi:MAG: T9SS type A sorting domain-containing protein [Lewinellaceae bacterium]|nr:T9SS type A sorting domain-containing protein [Lewinellaceae bacterium]